MRAIGTFAKRAPRRPSQPLGAGAALFAAVLCISAQADTLLLKDGSSYEGRVIERTADYVEFQVHSGGISAKMRFDVKDIASLTESPPESAQLAEQHRQKLTATEEAGTAAAFADLGRWCNENRLYDKAVAAYQKARQLAPDQDAAFGLAAARNLALGNQLRAARALLRELAERFPADEQIAAELARLDQQAQKRVDQLVRLALGNYKKGEMRPAVNLMERLGRLDLDDLADRAERAAMQLAGMSFGQFLADARLHQPCPACSEEAQLGLLPCPACRGSGKAVKTRIEQVTEKDPKTGQEIRRAYQVEYPVPCPTCRGFTVILCNACHGAGVDLGTVGAIEKPFVVDGIKRRIEFLFDRIAPYAAEPSALDPVNLEVVHLHACRLRYYMQQYILLCPDLAGTDLTTLADRRTSLDNLLRHTTLAYRNRDLEEYKEAIAARLRDRIRKDGLLWPEDFDYQEPPGTAGGPKTPTRPERH